MLVLTRRSKDKICFPQLGITIHFIRAGAGQVKVGVDAPRDIAIVRDEVPDGEAVSEFVQRQIAHLPQRARHGIRNELHEIGVGLHLYRELIRADVLDEAEETFAEIQASLARLDSNEVLQRPEPGATSASSTAVAISIIESNANERTLLAELLRMKGYEVLEFADSAQLSAYLEENEPPALLLSDMQSAGGGSAQMIADLRGSERICGMPIFAVSATSPTELGLAMGRAGVDVWFPKPVSVESLFHSIQQTIGAPDSISSAPQANQHRDSQVVAPSAAAPNG